MKKDKLVLMDGTIIELETAQGISALTVFAESKTAACALWERFTPGNLKQVIIKNGDDLVIAKYQDMVLDHITGNDSDGTTQIIFSLREKSIAEVLTERIETLEAGQQTQDEAIGDLGQAVSDIAEGGTQ